MEDDANMHADDFPFVMNIQSVFFEAANAGYVSGAKPSKFQDQKGYRYQVANLAGEWEVLDRWTSGHHFTVGTTLIYLNGKPVWYMHYTGSYGPQHTDFLKLALRANYGRNVFLGGRGPQSFSDHMAGLVYRNYSDPEDDFMRFTGSEKILSLVANKEGAMLGWHEFSGGLMCPPV